ncbi:hypothetical protein ACQP25_17095 [Microtetraspora malaysiensis]|uniref:hypothetical protein n=1 Tax=Microtetraspora malaysiensis TaxID=161358 RepID=UPI003D9396AC
MNENDIRRGRQQYNAMRAETLADLRRLLRSVQDTANSLGGRLEVGYLDQYDMASVDALVDAAVAVGRKAAELAMLDKVDHLVPTEEDIDDEDDQQ